MALTRSQNMARIRRANTRPEELLRKRLWNLGFRYRTDAITPAGKADLVVASRKIAVFVDGCFWHGCPEHYVCPRTPNPHWARKLIENFARDCRQTEKLRRLGWTVIRVWEHQILEDLDACAAQVLAAVHRGGRGSWPEWRVTKVETDTSTGMELRTLRQLMDLQIRVERGPRSTAKLGRVVREIVRSTK